MFPPLVIACLALPFVAFNKPQRYIVLFAVLLSIVGFFVASRGGHKQVRPIPAAQHNFVNEFTGRIEQS